MQNRWMPAKGKSRRGALNTPAPKCYDLRSQFLTPVPKGSTENASCQVNSSLVIISLYFGTFTDASLASLA